MRSFWIRLRRGSGLLLFLVVALTAIAGVSTASAGRTAEDPIAGTWTRTTGTAQVVVRAASGGFAATVTQAWLSENSCNHPVGQLVWEQLVKGSSGVYTGINHGFVDDTSAGCHDQQQSITIELGPVSGGKRSIQVCNQAGYGCATWTRPATAAEIAPAKPAAKPTTLPGGRTWTATATQYRGKIGSRYTYTCPAGGVAHIIWGTTIYTDDSSVCTAAVHAGRITLARGGTVTIEMRAARTSYQGTTRYGITSHSYRKWHGSFVIVSAAALPSTGPATGGTGWEATAVAYRGMNGSRYTYSCPAGGVVHAVWGTDLYTDDSSVCTAAVHAGRITIASGGSVTIEIRAAASSYTGSTRNGVTTTSYGPWHGSFVFVG